MNYEYHNSMMISDAMSLCLRMFSYHYLSAAPLQHTGESAQNAQRVESVSNSTHFNIVISLSRCYLLLDAWPEMIV